MVPFLSSNLERGSPCEYFMKNAEGSLESMVLGCPSFYSMWQESEDGC